MSRSLFSERGLARHIRPQDAAQFSVDLKNNRNAVFRDASTRILHGDIDFEVFYRTIKGGKTYVSYKDYATILLLRALTHHIRRRFDIATSRRDDIALKLTQALMDSTEIQVLRRDIRSFYETIANVDLISKVVNDSGCTHLMQRYYQAFFSVHCSSSEVGLPRGVGLSAMLAEMSLQEFDLDVRHTQGVYRYFRYADDILILSTGDAKSVGQRLATLLPIPLEFNPKKELNILLPSSKEKGLSAEIVSFLGYDYKTEFGSGKDVSRTVSVRIAQAKLDKIKSRLFLTYKSYVKEDDWDLFLERIRYLSTNFRVRRGRINVQKRRWFSQSGIFYNYKFCGLYVIRSGFRKYEPYNCAQLKELDSLNHRLLHDHVLRGQIYISRAQFRSFKRLSFYKGFELKIHSRFSGEDINSIKRCWVHAG